MNEHIEFKHEGQSLEELQKAKDLEAAAAAGKKDPADNGGDKGGGAAPDKKPFHEDPEVQNYITRQVESRLTEVEKKHQTDLEALRKEIAAGGKPVVTAEKPPRWFGGNQEQWEEFQDWVGSRTAKTGEGVLETLNKNQQQKEQAEKEATDFLNSEIAAIQSDKTLNPKGLKVDPKKLLEVALENELIDSKQRWNYRGAWRILRPILEAAADEKNAGSKDRKKIAGASVNDDKGGGDAGAAKPFKTSADFAKKRPW